jgi:hypothetical protein
MACHYHSKYRLPIVKLNNMFCFIHRRSLSSILILMTLMSELQNELSKRLMDMMGYKQNRYN